VKKQGIFGIYEFGMKIKIVKSGGGWVSNEKKSKNELKSFLSIAKRYGYRFDS